MAPPRAGVSFVAWIAACALVAAQPPAPVGETARWVPPDAMLAPARAACEAGEPRAFSACLIDELARRGAPAEAIAVARRIHDVTKGQVAFLRDFRETGRVSVACVVYPIRANENNGCWLVNGRPALVDLDDQTLLPKQHLPRDDIYAGLVRRHGEITLWPGDRTSPSEPSAAATVSGGQRFTASYLLRKGCHACEVVGLARFAFDFDADGAFTRASLVSVTDRLPSDGPPTVTPIGPAGADPARTLHVIVGQTFTLTLDAPPSAGQRWRLARDLDAAIVVLVDQQRRTTPGTRLGRAGHEVWRFRAAGAGTATLPFEYAKAGSTPTRTLVYTVVVR